MLDAALKLSNSRALLVGAVVTDTLFLGTLATLLISNGQALSYETGVLILTALAITAPVLAISVGMSSLIVPGGLKAEERARRYLLAGSVMHGGVQTGTLLQSCCGKMPSSFATYFAETFALTFITMLVMASVAFVARHATFKKRRGVRPVGDRDTIPG